jgi:cysteine desulfurase
MNDCIIYLDNAAAAKPELSTTSFFADNLYNNYFNQEAGYIQAYQLKREIDNAKKTLAQMLTGDISAIVFYASSGTDLFNLIGKSPLIYNGNIIIAAEHPALIASLSRTGAELRAIKMPGGIINPAELAKNIDSKTVMITIHHVHSETGCIQNLAEIGKTIRKIAPNAIFMSDTIQSAGKIPIPWDEAGLDIITISGHKIGAPSIAAALIRNTKKTEALISFFNKARKNEYLSGRDEPAAVFTLNDTIINLSIHKEQYLQKIIKLNSKVREYLQTIRLKDNKKIKFTIAMELSSPYIIHFIVPGYESAVLVRMLSEQGICVAAGSACQAENARPSPGLIAMGYPKSDLFSGMRISLWHHNTEAEIDDFIDTFQKVIDGY